MATGSVPCPNCGQPVPGDRAACPNCGVMMGETAGRLVAGPAAAETPTAATPTAETPPAETAATEILATDAAVLRADPAAPPDAEPAGAAVRADEGPAGVAAADPHQAAPDAADWDPGEGMTDDPSSMDDGVEGGGIASARVAAGGVAPGGVPSGFLPGAYLPPTTVHRPPVSPVPAPQMPLAASPKFGAPSPPPTPGWTPPSLVVIAPAPVAAGRASLFADLPFDAPDSMTEWLVAVGSVVAATSFLLPWVPGTISYATSWGLASTSRLPILLLLVITAILGILPNRVTPWVRSGVLGLVAGSLFLGNIWPIVVGDFGGAAFGVIVGAAAAVVLITGGILGVAPPRNGPEST